MRDEGRNDRPNQTPTSLLVGESGWTARKGRRNDPPLPLQRAAGDCGLRGNSILLMAALPIIGGFGPASEDPGFRWKPSVHWLCKRQVDLPDET